MKITKQFYNVFEKENTLVVIACIIIILFFTPYFYFGTDSHLLIHDNLDGLIPHVKLIVENEKIISFPNFQFYQVLNGLPRSSLYGTYDFNFVWFDLFGMFWGYVFNKLLMAMVGFFGMLYLLKSHFLPPRNSAFVPVAVSLLFAVLPFWSFNMSVVGLPLLVWSFLNIRKEEENYFNWFIIIGFPFFSSLFFSGFFIMVVFLGIIIYDFFKTKNINKKLFLALFLLGLFYVISHFPLFSSFIFSDGFQSHREAFQQKGATLIGSLWESFKIFLLGQYHAHSLHTFILLPILIYAIYSLKSKKRNFQFFIVLFFIILTSLFYGFLNWEVFLPILNKVYEVLPIQLNRFHFLHPMLWYILFAISLDFIFKNFRYGKMLIFIAFLIQLMFVASYHELIKNGHTLSFKEFYAEEQFDKINKFIGKPQESYRVVSIGIHPAIAQYNGFYTLDGYVSNYPLTYKESFRRIIEQELEKDPVLKSYYDNWGSRVYAFSAELGKPSNSKINTNLEIEDLDFNFKALKNMGGKYIISIAKINNQSNIKLLKTFEDNNLYRRLYLYKVL